MNSSIPDVRIAEVLEVAVSEETLRVELSDGRTLSVPTGWYPRITYATEEKRGDWTTIDGGRGIHWPELDEDVSLQGLLGGRGSKEGQLSFWLWVETRSGKANKR